MAARPKREEERRALLDGRRGPDTAAMALHNPLHDRQPGTGALVLFGAVLLTAVPI